MKNIVISLLTIALCISGYFNYRDSGKVKIDPGQYNLNIDFSVLQTNSDSSFNSPVKQNIKSTTGTIITTAVPQTMSTSFGSLSFPVAVATCPGGQPPPCVGLPPDQAPAVHWPLDKLHPNWNMIIKSVRFSK